MSTPCAAPSELNSSLSHVLTDAVKDALCTKTNTGGACLSVCPLLCNSDVLSVSTGTPQELPSPRTVDPSEAVDESLRTEIENDCSLQLLPVVDAPRVSEIAEQQRQDPELSPILAYVRS